MRIGIIILLVFCSLLSFGQRGATPNLRAIWGFWKFENNANDEVSSGVSGTVSGATYTSSGKVGGCYDFDGSNDYVRINSTSRYDFERTDEFSFTAWVNRDAGGMIVGNMTTLDGIYRGIFCAVETDGTITFILRNSLSTTRAFIQSTSTLSASTWHHVVYTYDGTSSTDGMTLYLDGANAGKSVITNTLDATIKSGIQLYFGSRGGGDAWFDGRIDEPKVFKRELTATEAKQLYAGGNGLKYVQENFKNDNNYENLINYTHGSMYFAWIESATAGTTIIK